MDEINIIKPKMKDKELFEEYKNDFFENNEYEIHGDLGLDTNITYEKWLDRISEFENGKRGIKKTLFALLRKSDNKVLGTFTICHKLDKGLYLYGGHIAGSIRPSEREKGYAKLLLNLALDESKKMGIEYVLLTCDKKNIPSSKTIKSCGGKLENIVISEDGEEIERYWFNLGKPKIKPEKLKKCFISVVSPSTNLKEKNINDINDSIKMCEGFGLKVKISKNAYSTTSEKEEKIKEKISDLHDMIIDKEVKAIFFAKGGKFCQNLIDKINYEEIKNNYKIIGGISDGTFLLNAIYEKTGLITFHMSDFKRFVKNNEYNELAFKQMFFGTGKGIIPQREKWKTLKDGVGTGTLVGGNLTCFTLLSDTKYFPTDKNLILFLEDLEGASTEEQIKNNIKKLKDKGILERTKGLLIADYINEKNIAFEDLLLPLLKEYDFPIIKCHDFGHGGVNCVLPIGAMTTICGFSSEVIINDEVLK